MESEPAFEIHQYGTQGRLPRLPFLTIKNAILGKKYIVSVACVDDATSKKLNRQYRGKNNSTNILSFPLQKNSGELVLCPSVMKKEAPKFNMSYSTFFGFLVIHGMLHLKGMEHGSTMEHKEEFFKKKFDLLK